MSAPALPRTRPYRYLPGHRVVAVRSVRWAEFHIGDTGVVLEAPNSGPSGALVLFDSGARCWVASYEMRLLG